MLGAALYTLSYRFVIQWDVLSKQTFVNSTFLAKHTERNHQVLKFLMELKQITPLMHFMITLKAIQSKWVYLKTYL